MVIAAFFILDKLGKIGFFEEIYILVDINIHVILKISFFTFSNADIEYGTESFNRRYYNRTEALPIA